MPTTEHRRRRCLIAGEPPTDALGSAFLDRAAIRLGRGTAVLGGFVLLVAAIEVTVPRLLDAEPSRPATVWANVALAVLCAATSGLILGHKVCARHAIRFGVALEIVGALVISLAIYIAPLAEARDLSGITGSSLWVLVMPFLVPLPVRRRWLISAIAASMPLAVVAVLDPAFGYGVPSGELLAQVSLPNWLCGLLGIMVSQQVVAWGTEVTQARREAEQLGSYQLVEKLGEGGMGEVWRAEHRMLARPAAIKFVRRSDAMDPTAVERFEREAQATARLTSPHTVRIYDFGVDDDGRFFYVMELLDGLDLETFLQRHGPMPAKRVVHIARQVCRSLAEAHDHGMIHRDIKPANIYLCRLGGEYDVAKVLDFGLVLRSEQRSREANARLTDVGFVTGTPGFLAPEAARGRDDIDHRVDVYSLGCVLFLLLTGQSVIDERGKTPMEVLMAHIKEPRRRPSELGIAGVPPALEELILELVAPEREERPGDLRAIERRLATCGSEEWNQVEAEAWWLEHGPPAHQTSAVRAASAPTATTAVPQS